MKRLVIIILSSFVVLISCTTKHTNHEKEEQKAITPHIRTDTVYIVEYRLEDFIRIIKRFHTDTVLQQQRVADVIHGYNSDEDSLLYFDFGNEIHYISSEDYTWDMSKIVGFLRTANILAVDTSSEFERYIIIRSDSVIEEKFAIPGSGTSYIYTFKKNRGKWFFTELDYNCL